MATVYLGIGSNIEAEQNLRLAVQELRRRFAVKKLSKVYRNEPVGFDGPDFLNLVVMLETAKSPEYISHAIDEIHELAGRETSGKRYVSRTLDIDLLLVDELCVEQGAMRLPREDVLKYNFVLQPLAEIAPDYVHPRTGRTLSDHWKNFAGGGHPLTISDVVL